MFPAFVPQDIQNNGTNWDATLRNHYHYRRIEELEGARVQYIRNGRQQPTQLASNRGTDNWREAGRTVFSVSWLTYRHWRPRHVPCINVQ